MNSVIVRLPAFERDHAVFFVLIGVAVVLLVGLSPPLSGAIARFVLPVALVVAVRLLHRKGTLFLASAPFLLAVLTLFFYVLLPWALTLDSDRFLESLKSVPPLTENPYTNNTAERFVLLFAAAALVLAVIAADRIRLPVPRPILPGPRFVIVALGLAALSAGAWVIGKHWLSSASWNEKQVLDAFLPLTVVFLSVAFLDSLARNILHAVGVLACALIVSLVLLVFGSWMKIGGILALSMGVLIVAQAGSWRKAIMVTGALTVFFILVLGHFSILRYHHRPNNFSFTDQLLSKMVVRQLETGYCLNKTIDLVAKEGSWDRHPLYFLGGFVPRPLWKDKPSLSDIGGFAAEFCFNNKHGNWFSMTLMGEPLLFAGKGGLATAAVFFLVAHVLILLGIARAGPAGAVALLALAPWLTDFDQSFAFYWANAVKMFLYMLPVLAAVAMLAKRRAKGSPLSPEPSENGPGS